MLAAPERWTTSIPKPSPRRAIACPIRPAADDPQRRAGELAAEPVRRLPRAPLARADCRRPRRAGGRSRAAARRRGRRSRRSARRACCRPGCHARAAASRSMLSVPTAKLAIDSKRGAASSSSASTRSVSRHSSAVPVGHAPTAAARRRRRRLGQSRPRARSRAGRERGATSLRVTRTRATRQLLPGTRRGAARYGRLVMNSSRFRSPDRPRRRRIRKRHGARRDQERHHTGRARRPARRSSAARR